MLHRTVRRPRDPALRAGPGEVYASARLGLYVRRWVGWAGAALPPEAATGLLTHCGEAACKPGTLIDYAHGGGSPCGLAAAGCLSMNNTISNFRRDWRRRKPQCRLDTHRWLPQINSAL